MTISATTRRFDYTGNGVTVDFSFPRPFAANPDLKVYLVLISTGVATLQVYATNYTVAGAGLDAGGTVTMLVAPSALQKIVIFGDTDATQNLDLDAVTSWPMTSIEYAFDRLTIMVQELWDRLLRVPYAPREYVNTFDYKLPLPIATYQLGVNSAGTGFEYRTPVGNTWIVGAGVPAVGTGVTGDMYINSTTGDVYGPKTTVWGGIVLNIKGPAGASGGIAGPGVSAVDNIATWNAVDGTVLKDSGIAVSSLAPKASPTLTGTPTAPTAGAGTNTTQIATTAFVKAAIDVILGGVAAAFDTLSEIATELNLKAYAANAALTGTPLAPTAGAGTNTTQIATTAFVTAAVAAAGSGTAASQAEQEAASDTTKFVSPGRQQFHPSAAKFWAVVAANGATLTESYNVTSHTDGGLGNLTITIATDFSTATWCAILSGYVDITSSTPTFTASRASTKAAGTIVIVTEDQANVAADPTQPYGIVGFGDQ